MGHGKVIELLLDYGAEANLQTEGGWSALMFASEFGHSQDVKTLLRYSADVNLTTAQGKTALMITIEARHLQVIHLFGELVHVNFSEYGDMPFIQYRSYNSANLTLLNSQLLNMLQQSNDSSRCVSLNDTQFTSSTHKAIMASLRCPHSDKKILSNHTTTNLSS